MSSTGIIQAAIAILEQGLAMLGETSDDTYGRVLPPPFEASIGQHYRHVLDHFFCLNAGMLTGQVDYDERSRSQEVETRIETARAQTRLLINLLRALSPEACTESCVVRYSVGYASEAAERTLSTYARELAFCVGHAIHHYAIVRLLCAQNQVQVPIEFGIAPSTLKYRAAQAN